MNGTLKSPKKNSNQKKPKKRIVDETESAEGNIEPEKVVDSEEPLKVSEKDPLEKELPVENGKCIAVYREDPMEEPDDVHEENTEVKLSLKKEGFHQCVIGIEKTEKYEEVRTTNITSEITHVEESIPSFQDQIVSASNKIKKQASKDNVLPSNTNILTLNDSNEIKKSSFANTENGIDDHNYMTAQTLRVGSKREEDTIELRRMECTDAYYNRNTDVYSKNYSSSENMQETDELFSDTTIDTILDEFKTLGNNPDKPDKENEQVMIHESEYGFKYEEKHYVSKLEKQSIDGLRYKPLSLEANMTEQGPPVITTQPPLQRTRSGRLFKPLPMTHSKITDEVDSKIYYSSEKKQEDKDNYSELLNVKYKSNCMLDCFCCVVESFI